ncbi:MAG: hypothetical protein CMD97_00025 [Gammaproteobacteria bacterium]|nr:hypothetical protein [Gammaproteobacteria bacterium]
MFEKSIYYSHRQQENMGNLFSLCLESQRLPEQSIEYIPPPSSNSYQKYFPQQDAYDVEL